MLELKIRDALILLLDNPFQKTKNLLPEFEDRRKLYSLPAFEIIVNARREGKKATSRVKRKIKKDKSIRVMIRKKKGIAREIEFLPSEEKVPVKAERVVQADKKQGGKSISYYDAESQALAKDEKYVCLMHNLSTVSDQIFEKRKQIVNNAMEVVPVGYRHYAAEFLRKNFGYAPAKKAVEIPPCEKEKKYKEINLFADSDDLPENSNIEELMLPESQSKAEINGWSKLGQAGYINPETGRLQCSFA